MIKVEHIDVWGFEGAVRGARNPMNSWERSDSVFGCNEMTGRFEVCLGPNDLDLLRRLYKAGSEHRKYMRQIFVSLDITAPFYWWKQFDTYKIGTTSNSCSTMHKLTAKPFDICDFSHEHLLDTSILSAIIEELNKYRNFYLHYDELKDTGVIPDGAGKKDIWWQMIQLLPESYNQKRTISMNYENVILMTKQRKNHKLDEWNELIDILYTLPYIKEILEVQ